MVYMINFNQDGLNFRYKPAMEGQNFEASTTKKSKAKPSISYRMLDAQGKSTERHERIDELFSLIDKKLISAEIDASPDENHSMVVKQLTNDSFAIKLDGTSEFTLSLGDAKEAIDHDHIARERPIRNAPFSKALTLNSDLLAGIEDKRLAFTQGDTFIKGSGLEGGDTTSNLQFLMPYLTANPHLKGKLDLAPLRECLERETQQLPRFDSQIENAHQIYKDQIEKYADTLANQVSQLEVGKKFILSGGWASTGAGHAMMYIIEKTDPNTYSFTIVNTGAGLHYHTSQKVGFKEMFCPVVKINQIDAQTLTKPDIFQTLLELNISIKPEGNSWEHDSSEIYERIVPALNGERDYAFENSLSLITPQRSGTCAWKVLMKLTQILVETDSQSTEPYKKFVFDLRRDSLKAYYNRIVNREIGFTDERLLLLKLSTENFARAALKQHQAGLITDSELAEIKSFTHIILDDIRRLKVLRETLPPLDFKYIYDFSKGALPAETFKIHTPKGGVVDEMDRIPESTKVFIDKLPATPQELNALLQKIVTDCKKLHTQELGRASMQRVLDVIKAIPPNALQPKGYWEQLATNAPIAEIEKTISLFNELSQYYFAGITLIAEDERGTPDQYAAQLILLAANDKLIDQLDSEYNIFKDSNRLANIPELRNWNINPFAIINDSQLRLILSESRQYLQFKSHLSSNVNASVPKIKIEFRYGRKRTTSSWPSVIEKFYNQPKFKENVLKKWPDLKDASDYDVLKK